MKICLRRLSSLLILASALRCGNAPTEPLPRATPTPTSADLTGHWRGTFDTTGCPPNEAVEANIVQNAKSVSGFFQTQCAPGWTYVSFDGTLSSDNVLGIELVGGNDITIDKLAGKVSSQEIDLRHATESRTTSLHLSR